MHSHHKDDGNIFAGMSMADRLNAKIRRAGLSVNPPTTESDVAQFESEAGVSIPNAYREFIIKVANGGREPCRLVPLAAWSSSYWLESPEPCMAAKPCIVTPEAYAQGERWLDMANVPHWEERWDREEWSPMFGTIAIAEIGCGLYFSLIMTGAFRGRIFSWGDAALIPPYLDPAPSFAAWFEENLDATLAGKPVHFLDGRLYPLDVQSP